MKGNLVEIGKVEITFEFNNKLCLTLIEISCSMSVECIQQATEKIHIGSNNIVGRHKIERQYGQHDSCITCEKGIVSLARDLLICG